VSSDGYQLDTAKKLQSLRLQKARIEEEIEALKHQLPHYPIPSSEKIELFKQRFFARTDVVAKERVNKKGYYPLKSNYDSDAFTYLPLTHEHIVAHLQGKMRLGSYTITPNNRASFLVIDLDDKAYEGPFSKGKALEDAQNIIESAKKFHINLYPELSKSAKGVHLWLWFSEPVIAANARRLGDLILSEAIHKTSLSLSSFDRFFPSQDFIAEDGLGNLIALPLHLASAKHNNGTLFFDPETLEPHANQFLFLQHVTTLETAHVYELTGHDTKSFAFQNAENFYLPPWERYGEKNTNAPLPEAIALVLDDGIYIPHEALSKKAIFRLQQLVSFYNPDYIKAQKMKKRIFNIPRFLSAFEMDTHFIKLPLGVLQDVEALFERGNCTIALEDKRQAPLMQRPLQFAGTLKEEQNELLEMLREENRGIVQAKTGFGKTIAAIALACELGVKTLILVTKLELLKQWVDEIVAWTGVQKKEIGIYSGNKKKLKGDIAIATATSLSNAILAGERNLIRDQYGLLIVDECHHVASFSATTVMQAYNGKYAFGFSATLERSDHKTPFVHYALGEVLYKNLQQENRTKRIVEIHSPLCIESAHYHELVTAIVEDNSRNANIVATIKRLGERKKLLLSERIEHLYRLSVLLESERMEHIVVHGAIAPKERATIISKLRTSGLDTPLVLATTSLVGEGMDLKDIDTLILATPLSHRSRVLQIMGRIGRDHKRDLLIVDVCDKDPILSKLYQKRLKIYQSQGYMFI